MKIAVFAGHGGSDPGAVDPIELEENDGIYQDDIYSEESDINLAAALILQPMLEQKGHEVLMARTEDIYVSLYDRVDMANENDVDLVISLHANAASNSTAAGIETLYYSSMRFTSRKGKRLAGLVQTRLIDVTDTPNRGIKGREKLWVLRKTDMPAIFVEMGFITNLREEKLLNEREYLYLLMEAVAKGVEDYLKESS